MYDYKHCSQKSNVITSLSPNKSSAYQQAEKKQILPIKSDDSPRGRKTESDANVIASPVNSSRSNDSKVSNTPENIKNANTTSNSRLPSRTGFNGSPKTLVQPSGSVLSKASIFEAKNTETKAKDPAQMSLAERMAFFERNKGEALIPKAPLTMSIPPKKLQEKDKQGSNTGIYSLIVKIFALIYRDLQYLTIIIIIIYNNQDFYISLIFRKNSIWIKFYITTY